MGKILVIMPFPEDERAEITTLCKDRFSVCFLDPEKDVERYRAALADAEVILGDASPEDLSLCRKLKLLQCTWAGVDHYVRANCIPEGAAFCNVSGAYGRLIAEHMLGLILSVCCRLPQYRDHMRSGTWACAGNAKTLEGTNVLILGAGDIGTCLAQRIRPSVATVTGVCRKARAAYPDCYDRVIHLDELDAVLPEMDVVACSLPETPETHRLLDARRLRAMKRDAVLVNVGRGGLIDSDALAEVLSEGHLFGAGLDVTSPEPLPKEHPLWRQERCLITPHVSGNAFGPDSPTMRRIRRMILDNLANYVSGRALNNVVDMAVGYRA